MILFGLLVAVFDVSASGAGFIGPPTAELDQGQWNAGFNYMYSEMGLDKTKMTESWMYHYEVPPFPDHDGSGTDIYKMEIDNVKTQRYYGTIGYGLKDSWEVYVQLGIADVKARTRDEGESMWDGLNFDNDFAWDWGTRYTFHEQGKVRWGASVQMNWLDTCWEEKSTGEAVVGEIFDPGEVLYADTQTTTQIDWSTYDLLIAVGPTVSMGGWNLYGGPFYYMQKGDLDLKATTTYDGVINPGALSTTGVSTDKASGDLEVDTFGVFVGTQCTLMDKYCMTTEFALSGEGWALGAGVAVPF
ncbi:hypothetical protein ACFL5F_05340 [Planctomycetota bacterium]